MGRCESRSDITSSSLNPTTTEMMYVAWNVITANVRVVACKARALNQH